jgi:hypothetical protein
MQEEKRIPLPPHFHPIEGKRLVFSTLWSKDFKMVALSFQWQIAYFR